MVDTVDMAVEIEAEHLERGLRLARRPIPAGVPGECSQCFEDSARLVGGRCAYCRDGRRRPLNPTGKQPTPTPALPEEELMPSKSVQLPATAGVAISCLETYAAERGLSQGAAAAELIERGAGTIKAQPEDLAMAAILSVDALFDMLRERFDQQHDQSAELADAIARADAAEGRAEAAEAKLAQLKALVA